MVSEFQNTLLLGKIQPLVIDTLTDLFDDMLTITACESCPPDLSAYPLIICHDASWLDEQSAVDLFLHTLNGGGLLCIGEGTDMRHSQELCNVIGARMEEHEPMTHLVFSHACKNGLPSEHPDFELVEMPYRYRFDPYTERKILLTYGYGKLEFPAMWANEFGAGKAVCLTAGHSAENLSGNPVKRLLYSAAAWICGKAEKLC